MYQLFPCRRSDWAAQKKKMSSTLEQNSTFVDPDFPEELVFSSAVSSNGGEALCQGAASKSATFPRYSVAVSYMYMTTKCGRFS